MMNKFNTYDLIERYRKGSVNMLHENTSKEVAFRTLVGEDKEMLPKENQNEFYKIVYNMENGNFSEFDISIVCLVAQFKYITTKQIFENLILMGFETNETKVINSINKLYKNQLEVRIIKRFLLNKKSTVYNLIKVKDGGKKNDKHKS